MREAMDSSSALEPSPTDGMSASARTSHRARERTPSTCSASVMIPSTPDSRANVTSSLLKGTLLK